MATPEILQTGLLKTPTNMNVETALLYPVSISQKRAKFIFDRKGVLNSNSRLQLRAFQEEPSYTTLTATGGEVGQVVYGNPLLPVVAAAGAEAEGVLSLFSVAGANTGCVVACNPAGNKSLIDAGMPFAGAPAEFALADIEANPTHFAIVARKTGVAPQAIPILTATLNGLATQLTLTFTATPATWNIANLTAAGAGVDECCIYDMTKVQLSEAQDAGAIEGSWEKWTLDATGIVDRGIISNIAASTTNPPHAVAIDPAHIHVLVKADLGVHTTRALRYGAGGNLTISKLPETRTESFFPLATGVASLIQNATLEIGGRRISTLEQVGQYNTIKHLALSNEYRDQVASVQEGLQNVLVGSTLGATTLKEIETPKSLLTGTTEGSKFSIALSDLVPMLKGLRLPLFLMEQEVALHLDFSSLEEGVSTLHTSHADFRWNAGKLTLDTNNIVVMADYLFFPEEMAQITSQINSGGGLSIPYEDILTIEAVEEAVATVAGAATTFIQKIYSKSIALAGKRCKSVIVQLGRPTADYNKLLGVYYSKDYQRPSSYNFIMDGAKPYYTNDIVNPAVKYNEVGKCVGRPLQVSNQRYTFSNTVGTALPYSASTFQTPATGAWKINGSFEGHLEEDLLTATAHYTGIDFSLKSGSAQVVGKKFGNLPMFYKHDTKRIGQNNEILGTNPLRFYCAIQKVFNIRKGVVEVVDL